MLVLTRKAGESIIIGSNIEVKVLSAEGGSVRIGIKAPREVSVYRRELYDAIREENLQALQTARAFSDQLSSFLLRNKETEE